MTISIAIADDQPIVRHGIRSLLARLTGVTAVGEAFDAASTLELVEQTKPTVLIIDLAMAGGGIELLRTLTHASPDTRTLVFSARGSSPFAVMTLQNGASGFALKTMSTTEFLEAVRTTASGRRYVSPQLADIDADAPPAHDPYDTLTRREREIFKLSAEGLNNTKIGERLTISPRTVETHRTSFMRKLGLRSQTELIRFALRQGIVPAD